MMEGGLHLPDLLLGSAEIIQKRLAHEFGPALQGDLISVLSLTQTHQRLRQVRICFLGYPAFQGIAATRGDGGRGFQASLHGAIVPQVRDNVFLVHPKRRPVRRGGRRW